MSVMGILIPDENKIRVSLFVHFNNQPASLRRRRRNEADKLQRQRGRRKANVCWLLNFSA
jgi:hypothetical protein